MAFVYILQSQKSGNYYIGSTKNFTRRLKEHDCGMGHTMRRFLPYKLVLHQKYNSIEEAQWVERKLKGFKRKDYIKKIVEYGYIRIKLRRLNS